LIINALGWVDTYAGLISTELVSVWGIFLLRQFFVTLPRDLEDAARLDGAGEWTVFWRVVLPLSRPALATLAVFAFVDQWKSFLWPLIATRSAEMRVVEVGVGSCPGYVALASPPPSALGRSQAECGGPSVQVHRLCFGGRRRGFPSRGRAVRGALQDAPGRAPHLRMRRGGALRDGRRAVGMGRPQ